MTNDIIACVMPSVQTSSGFLKKGFGSHNTFRYSYHSMLSLENSWVGMR